MILAKKGALLLAGGAPQPSLVNLEARFRADLGITIDTGVSQWNDISGNGYHVSQATAGNQPAFVADGGAAFNHRPLIRGDGSGDFLSEATLSLSQPFAVVVVGEVTADAGSAQAIVGDDGGAAPYMGVSSGEVPLLGASPQLNGSTDILGLPVLLEGLFNGGSSAILLNNAAEASGSADTSGLNGLRIFARGSGNFLGGDIAEVLIYSAALSAAQQAQNAAYVEAWYGIGG